MKHLGATGVAFSLLIVLIVEVGLSTRRQSVGWDEGDHIFAGYMNWKQDIYCLNPGHPPLEKLRLGFRSRVPFSHPFRSANEIRVLQK